MNFIIDLTRERRKEEEEVIFCGERRPRDEIESIEDPDDSKEEDDDVNDVDEVEIIDRPPQRIRRRVIQEASDDVIVLPSKPLLAQLNSIRRPAVSAPPSSNKHNLKPSDQLLQEENEQNTCPICFSTPPQNEVGSSVCKHTFCFDCINTWLSRYHKVCPVCKQPMTKSSLVNLD